MSLDEAIADNSDTPTSNHNKNKENSTENTESNTPKTSTPPQSKDHANFLLHQRIGKGSFATVYKGEYADQTVAIKVVHQRKLKRDRRLMDIFESEMAILKHMKHPHVVHLTDVIQTASDYNLIMEYCSIGELSRLIRGKEKLIKENADAALLFEKYNSNAFGGLHHTLVRHILAQLSSALSFLHSNHLVHRDLKPQNLLLKPPVGSQLEAEKLGYVGRFDLPIVKVADFGFARFLPATSMAETMCGSPLYMAPEILNREKYNANADLWSIGAVTYEMVMAKPPFPAANPMELMKMIDLNKSNEVPDSIPKDLKYVVNRLLVRDPKLRMEFDEFFKLAEMFAKDCENEADLTQLNMEVDKQVSAPTSPLTAEPSEQRSPKYMEYLRQQGGSDVAVQSPSPSPSPESSVSHSHLIPTVNGEKKQQEGDYVYIEKRTVEVNSLADDVQSPIAAQRRLTNPDKVGRRRRLSSIAYGASPTNALAQALLKSSMRLFGTGKESNTSDNTSMSSARLSRESSAEPWSTRLQSSTLSPDIYASLSTLLASPKGADKHLIDELEQLATIGKVVSLYADVKFQQLDISSISDSQRSSYHLNLYVDTIAGSSGSGDGGGRRNSSSYPIQSPSQIDPYLQLMLATEALALHLKTLSILSCAMDSVSDWFEQEHSKHKGKRRDSQQWSKPAPGINSLVQWVRDKFNECMDKAEIEKSILAKLKLETGSVNPPAASAERLLFDRGLEMAKAAAQQEVQLSEHVGKVNSAEMNYGTAVWMLKALLVSEKDGSELSEDDREMVEKMLSKIVDRMAAVRNKTLRGSNHSFTPP